ncbi:MAG: hypothetical protein KGD58_08340 [Candidatus Lokiarchaeota archaeon]|nr:hypothetical protein [Candidatus Lokiarchaeota archaeon]
MRYQKKELKHKIKREPLTDYKRGLFIVVLFLSLGVGQLIFVISTRSQLIWRYNPGPLSGSEIVNVPQTYLLPDRYVFTIAGYFPHILNEDVVGNVTLIHQASGKTYFFNYTIVGYLMYEKMILDAKTLHLDPGTYNISWDNNVDRFEYYFTTHGLFNLFPKTDRFPYLAETVILVVSIFGLIAFLVAAVKKYLKIKRNYSFYK